MSSVEFDGEVAVITGAGGGLGRCHVLALAQRGVRVVVNDLGGSGDGIGSSASPAEAVVSQIIEAGGEAVANHDSVSTPDGGAAIIQAAIDAFGTVDILINNAGILRDKSFAKLEPADLEAVIDVHLMGTFYVSQPAFKVMKEKGYGRFIHTSSAAGIFGNFGQTNYGAAKMGIVGFSNVLAIEGAKDNITSNVIAPVARTRLTENLLGNLADALAPEQVTPLVVYLASKECALSHELFSIGGGHIARAFVGLSQGWFAGKGVVPSPEDVRDHIDQIRDTEGFIVPSGAPDEMQRLVSELQG